VFKRTGRRVKVKEKLKKAKIPKKQINLKGRNN